MTNNAGYDFHSKLLEGETVTIVVDRKIGLVGFSIHGIYRRAFKNLEIMKGELYFACSAGDSGNMFEIG